MPARPRLVSIEKLTPAIEKIDELRRWADSELRKSQFQQAIHHYAPALGAEGIIRSNEFWLTHFRFTNDEDEIEHGLRLALDEIRHFLEKHRLLLAIIEERLNNTHQPDIYVACFSRKRDSIAQFDRYAERGTGAMITINPNPDHHYYIGYPQRGLVAGQINFSEVTYSHKEKIEKIRAYLNHFLPVAISLFEQRAFYEPVRTRFMLEFAGCLYRIISCFKNSGWEDEAEVRLAVTLMSFEKDPMSPAKVFRRPFSRISHDGTKEIPYYKSFPVEMYKIPELGAQAVDAMRKIRVRIDIPEVLVGPNGDTQRISTALKESGYAQTDVSVCNTRLRL